MTRLWTREERRRHIREKYYTWKEKLFAIVITLLAVFIALFLSVTGAAAPLQGISVLVVIIVVGVSFLVAFEGPKIVTGILVAAAIVFVLTAAALSLSGLGTFISSVVLGLVFLMLVAVAAFFIDMVTYESS